MTVFIKRSLAPLFAALLLVMPQWAVARDEVEFPAKGTRATEFAPEGWILENQYDFDFNQDGKMDLVVIAKKPPETAEDTGERVVLFLKNEGKDFSLFETSRILAMCERCGGSLQDPWNGVQLKRGSLTFLNYGGSVSRWSTTYTISWRKGELVLIGYENSTFNPSNARESGSVSLNLLTGEKLRCGANPTGKGKACSKVKSKALIPVSLKDLPQFQETTH